MEAAVHEGASHQHPRGITFRRLILLAALCGSVGGVIVAIYYLLLKGLLFVIWEKAILLIPADMAGLSYLSPVVLLTTLGGLLVGIAIRTLGTPGEIEALVDNIHLNRGRLDVKQAPSMAVTSLLSISFGGSAGPEAPSVQIVGSLASWLGDRLHLSDSQVRTLTFCGMAAALSAFFGAPLGGAIFALEIPHHRGLEYYEALLPTIVAALASFFTFYGITGYNGSLYRFTDVPAVSLTMMAEGIVLGLLGAAVAVCFIFLFKLVGKAAHPLRAYPVLLATTGGLCLGLLASVFPGDFPVTTLFWGEFEIRQIISSGQTLLSGYGMPVAALLLAGLAVAKMLAIGCTLHTGFRGGFIFPLFFIGAAAGMALSLAVGNMVPVATATLCMMAAINVAVTKTPVSTSIILTTISSTSMLPVIAVASITSFFATTRVSLIRTQRSRKSHTFKRKATPIQ